jgi:hypothetical protein
VKIFLQKFFALKVGLGQEELQGIRLKAKMKMKKKKKNTNNANDDDDAFIKVSSKLLQGLRLSPASSSKLSEEEERTLSSSPSKRMTKMERRKTSLMFPLKKKVGLKKEAHHHHHHQCWSATSSSSSEGGGGEEDNEEYGREQFTPLSSRASFDEEEEKEKDYYSRMNEEWCGTQMMDLDQFCANVKTTAVGESDDVEKSRSTTSFLTTEKITKRLLEGWSLARETCSECEMPMMRRNARRGDARWMDEVVCVECEDRDDEPRERFGRRRPGKRLALMEGKPRPPVGTKSFAKLYRGSNYSGEDQEELSPTSVL